MEHGTGRKHLTKCKEARGNRAVRDFKGKVTKIDRHGGTVSRCNKDKRVLKH